MKMFLNKNILLLFILGVSFKIGYTQVTVISTTTNSLIVDFTLPTYTIKDTSLLESFGINQTYSYVDVDDFGNIADIGFPNLPQYTIDLFVPSDATSFTVTQTNKITENVNLSKKIIPFVDAIVDDTLIFTINNEYYNSTGSLYAFESLISDTFNIMGANGISFSMFPFQYNPLLNKIEVIKSCRFTITHNGSSSLLKDETVGDPVSDEYLHDIFENYPILKAETTSRGRYLIITHPDFESTLTYFANYKRNIGYTVTVVNTNTTGATSSAIKNYIKTRYDNTSTRPNFVLLVGDVDKIPVSMGNTSSNLEDSKYGENRREEDFRNPISDLNYARLSGDDYYADVNIGRFSVKTLVELQNMINKTIYMETNLHKISKRAFLLTEDSYNVDQRCQEWNIKKFLNPLNYPYVHYNELDGALASDCMKLIREDNTLFIYNSHGWYNQLGGYFELNRDKYRIAQIENTYSKIYPFGFGFTCLSNCYAYAHGDCFGEAFTKEFDFGGVSYFGGTTVTYAYEDAAINKEIFSRFKEGAQLSPIIIKGLKAYKKSIRTISSPANQKRHIQSFNLLGDPSIYLYGIGCIENYNLNYIEIFNWGDKIIYQANNNIIQNNSFTVKSGADVKLFASNSIILKSGFTIEPGGTFIAEIKSCGDE